MAETRLDLWVHPGASREEVRWDPWRKRWVISVRAPAHDGKANRAVLALLATRLEVLPAALELVHGETSSAKRVRVTGLSAGEVERRLRNG